MSAVLLAIFPRASAAEQVRTALVRDGFPTDRVELTARAEKGRAGEQPASSATQQFRQYFGTLLNQPQEQALVAGLTERVASGEVAVIAVHPRGDVETRRAGDILRNAGALEVVPHDMASQGFEFAASPSDQPVVSHVLPERSDKPECFYCWLFPDEALRH